MLSLVFVALFIMFSWGVGDFFLAKLSKKNSPYLVNFWFEIFQTIFFGIAYFVLFFPSGFPLDYLWLLIVMPILSVIAFVCFLKGFEVGKVSLIAPITSAYGILTMILSLIFLGETLRPLQYVGIALSTLGLLLTAMNISELRSLRLRSEVAGLKFAIIAFVCWGINFTLFSVAVRVSNWVTPFFFYTPIIVLLSWMFWMKNKEKGSSLSAPLPLLAGIALIVVIIQAAFMLYSYSLSAFPSALLAPISAAYPGLTILLAHVFMKDKISLVQYFGIFFILCGLIIASF